MIHYSQKNFDSLFDRGEALSIDGMHFQDCEFSNCALSLTKDFAKRSMVKNVKLENCYAYGCDIGPADFEDVTVHNLATNDLLIVWGATFNRVKLSGDIGKLKINPYAHHVDRSESVQAPFDRHRLNLYSYIDWALDISDARFKEFDVRGIPARLIRRNPETQMIVTRERALMQGWQEKLSSTNTLWPFVIKMFLSDGLDDAVLVAPMGASKKKRDALIQGLLELREIGVLEPN